MPTLKQKKAFKEIVENRRTSVSAVMRDVGYSPNTAVQPHQLTESKGWKELMAQHFPDEKLAKVHAEGLEAVTGDEIPDYRTRHLYLDTAYKLKGAYAPDKSASTGNTFIQILLAATKDGSAEPQPVVDVSHETLKEGYTGVRVDPK